MRPLTLRLCLIGLLALFAAACQRTLIQLATQEGGGLSLATATAAAERTASVLDIQGEVETRSNDANPWLPAVEGQLLGVGGQIRTSVDGRALVRLTEGSKIRLGPDTLFTVTFLNPYLDSLLTSIKLEKGSVWVLLRDGALDVDTPFGIASARGAYLSVAFDARKQSVAVTCLQGTCSFGTLFIPIGFKLSQAEHADTAPERMTFADYGVWGSSIPEATQLAYLATEAVVQGSATVPVVATQSPTPTVLPTAAPTLAPQEPTHTASPPTPTPLVLLPPTLPPIPFTPIPPAPIIGRHLVSGGETLFCIARGYGVLPAAIAQANGLPTPFTVFPGQVLKIPAVQWKDILPGPVCQPQFASPFPALPFATDTPAATATTAGPPLTLSLAFLCVANCSGQQGEYIVRIWAEAGGGIEPYTFTPGETFDVTLQHCVTGTGVVTVISADGQTASAPWEYQDVNCPPASAP